jgi:RimJ/RimL family protein N-acetyltransferase
VHGFVVPDPPVPSDWRLEPLRPSLAEVDFAAFRSCRERLVTELGWSGWPSAHFTLADNVVDLAEHYDEHVRGEAYAFSVLAGRVCVGCVYVEPWTGGAQLAFWVVDAWLPRESEVVATVLEWLEQVWPLERVVVPVRPWNRRACQRLARLGRVPVAGPEGFITYARSTPP